MVLAVKGLPSGRIPESRLRGALVSHFSKHTGYKAAECKIIKGVGYMTFDHPAGKLHFNRLMPVQSLFACEKSTGCTMCAMHG